MYVGSKKWAPPWNAWEPNHRKYLPSKEGWCWQRPSLNRNLVELCSLPFKVWLRKFAEWAQPSFLMGVNQNFPGYTENICSNMFVQPPLFSPLKNLGAKFDNSLKNLIILKEAFYQSSFRRQDRLSNHRVGENNVKITGLNHGTEHACMFQVTIYLHHWDDLWLLHKKKIRVLWFHFVVGFRLRLQFSCPCSNRSGAFFTYSPAVIPSAWPVSLDWVWAVGFKHKSVFNFILSA